MPLVFMFLAVREPRMGILASDMAIAMACLGLFTTLPPLPECRVPDLNSPITLPTFFCALVIFMLALSKVPQLCNPGQVPAQRLRPLPRHARPVHADNSVTCERQAKGIGPVRGRQAALPDLIFPLNLDLPAGRE